MFDSRAATALIEKAKEGLDPWGVTGVTQRNAPVKAAPRPHSIGGQGTRSSFLARLRRMSRSERVLASRYQFSLRERNIWTAHYPDEVPRINGEFEWIAATLADNE